MADIPQETTFHTETAHASRRSSDAGAARFARFLPIVLCLLSLLLFAFFACKPSPIDPSNMNNKENSPAPLETLPQSELPATSAPTEPPAFSPTPSAAASAAPSASPAPSHSPAPSPTPDFENGLMRATYLGVEGCGKLTAADVQAHGAKCFRFAVDGAQRLYSIENDASLAKQMGEYYIQNLLYEGYEYLIEVENGAIKAAELIGDAFEPEDGTNFPVSYTSGQRTLKNLLAAAMQPVGHTLYIYGGGWNWQDDGASLLSRSIGTPRTWRDFFLAQNADYTYKDESSPETSYYPFGGWVEYFYAGLDCSGYLGWTLYNTLETENGGAGYVFKSTDFAKTLADMGLGTYGAGRLEAGGGTMLQSGDIVSFKGHTYMVLGRCSDGSLVILHSSPTASRTNGKGGGVQLSALTSDNSGGEALELIRRYTEKYYSEWYARYDNIAVPYSTYIEFERSGNAGFFRWSIGKTGLSDPDGYLNMSAEEILADLFG